MQEFLLYSCTDGHVSLDKILTNEMKPRVTFRKCSDYIDSTSEMNDANKHTLDSGQFNA